MKQETHFTLLLNEGTEDEQITTLSDYINAFDEDLEADFIPVINLKIGETYQYGADAIKRISPVTAAALPASPEPAESEMSGEGFTPGEWEFVGHEIRSVNNPTDIANLLPN